MTQASPARRAARLTLKDEAAPASPSPSEKLIAGGIQPEVLTAGDGMKISVRQPDVLAQYDLIEAVGPEVAANQTYMQMVNPLLYVSQINGEDVFTPANKGEVRFLINRLGHSGMAALDAWYIANIIGPTMDAIAKAEHEAKRQARVKN